MLNGGTQGLGADSVICGRNRDNGASVKARLEAAGAEAAQPFGRPIKPDDVARASLFLLGPDSGIMTGSVIDYDQMVMGAYD